jgi:uncharacterized protein involved in exopolysaccharide biosynthesis
MVRPVRGSKSTIRPVGLTDEVVKAPYELAQEEKKRRLLFIAIGVVGGLGLGITLLVVIGVL